MNKPLIKKTLAHNEHWVNRTETKFLVLHHAKAINFSFEQCDTYHKSLGWANIGYHFYIQKNGQIYEGRPVDVVGAHSYSSNHTSVGICLEGNFEIENPTKYQELALVDLLKWLVTKYTGVRIVPHSALDNTECPVFPIGNILERVYDGLEKKVEKEAEYITREEFDKYKEDIERELHWLKKGFEDNLRRLRLEIKAKTWK